MTVNDESTFDRRLASTFDRVLGTLDGLPEVTSTRPATVQTVLPFVGNVTTYVLRTFKSREAGFTLFLELVDAEGRARIVLPDKAVQAIYRQRQSLTDRSTPASRAAKAKARERAKAKAAREARKAAWALREAEVKAASDRLNDKIADRFADAAFEQ